MKSFMRHRNHIFTIAISWIILPLLIGNAHACPTRENTHVMMVNIDYAVDPIDRSKKTSPAAMNPIASPAAIPLNQFLQPAAIPLDREGYGSAPFLQGVAADVESSKQIAAAMTDNPVVLINEKAIFEESISNLEQSRQSQSRTLFHQIQQNLAANRPRHNESMLLTQFLQLSGAKSGRVSLLSLLKSQIEKIKTKDPHAQVVLIFSGHGVTCQTKEQATWCMATALPGKTLGDQLVPIEEIQQVTGSNKILLDSCHSGAANAAVQARAKVNGENGTYLFASSLTDQLSSDSKQGGQLIQAMAKILNDQKGTLQCSLDLDGNSALSEREVALGTILSFAHSNRKTATAAKSFLAGHGPLLPINPTSTNQLPTLTVSDRCFASIGSNSCTGSGSGSNTPQLTGDICQQAEATHSSMGQKLKSLEQNIHLFQNLNSVARTEKPTNNIELEGYAYQSYLESLRFLDEWITDIAKVRENCQLNCEQEHQDPVRGLLEIKNHLDMSLRSDSKTPGWDASGSKQAH